MTYEKTLRFQGDRAAVLEAARNAFLHQGFRLVTDESGGFEVAGPGMSSTRELPLTGVSKARVRVGEADISIQAELGSLRKMQYFAVLFPPSLVLVLTAVFFFLLPHGELFAKTTAPALLLTWSIIGPIMALRMRKRTVSALDSLLKNSVFLAKPTQ